ncbi:hypothetical protein [Ornithinimicrobium sp. INDO-MA30-4]|uniref:hypothetical protein n=1 Tax=Ornithinimicrobium sp. INDO-MA30-4 TaxID=2908651 RepID=UPI001F280941|nr:hypothetical protein [Ornithinimicrobium sp. INDO-MA30-4]UJH71771.1 hypothetical protein L0A91_16945 [Ornithinimicrobium sp. INDO-MA30-4]
MRRSIINWHTLISARTAHARQLLSEDRERGSFSVEVVVMATVLAALALAIGAALLAWATGKLGSLG